MPSEAVSGSKRMRLCDAIGAFVAPGSHLCFASTPSRSNAAVRELARRFRGRNPRFWLSATGFHSLLHLLPLLRLGRGYQACFFGDNYPTPRANPLYQQLVDEGYELQHWSLWSYVSALAAGAYGHPYALTRSLSGTSLGRALAERGRMFEVPDPVDPERSLTLLRPIVPDVTFIHAPVGDERGNVAFSPPFGEGFYGALAAQRGVIATVERIVQSEALRELPHLLPLPAHRVLAVCEEPFGAHPQPLHVAPRELQQLEPGYADDYPGYLEWRSLAAQGRGFAAFEQRVLAAADGGAAYRGLVGEQRLERLRRPRGSGSVRVVKPPEQLGDSDDLILLAGRALSRRILEGGHRALLAGIGQSFAACRLAKLLLAERGRQIELMVETGFCEMDAERADPFLLSRSNIAGAARLTSVDSVLGALCCGGTTPCIGVIGAAQVDVDGNVNSTCVDGKLLVGGGGAPDIAACAREVLVLCRADPRRLVRQVEYCTSRGQNVRTIVTEACVFERSGPGEPWVVRDIVPRQSDSLRALLQSSGFRFAIPGPPPLAPEAQPLERELLARVHFAAEQAPVLEEVRHG